MKAIGIDAIKFNDDLEIIKKDSTLIKALINTDGELVYENIIGFDTKEKIEKYADLDEFLETVLQTAKSEFGNDYHAFDISGINEDDKYLWSIRCSLYDDVYVFTFRETNNEDVFTETLIHSIKDSAKQSEDALGNVIFTDNFGKSNEILMSNGDILSKNKN